MDSQTFAGLFSDTTPLARMIFVQLPAIPGKSNGLEHGFELGECIIIDPIILPSFGDLLCFVKGERFHLRRFAVGTEPGECVGVIIGRCSQVRHGAAVATLN
jgi:hypothetical protein